MDWRTWDPPPVGVRRLAGPDDAAEVPPFAGISYCDAVRQAGEGKMLRVLPGSIGVCHWAPVVLGHKEPGDGFEAGLEPRLEAPAEGLLLAPLDQFPGEPEVVIVRTGREQLVKLMAALQPEIAVMDETDSGLDIDALRIVSEGVNTLRGPKLGVLVITHYQRILNYIKPDFVHIMLDGRVAETGGPDLALHLEEHGYDWLREKTA